jgi:hypothetical protein
MFANAENIQNKLVLKLWSIRRNIGHIKAKALLQITKEKNGAL